jgi:hypothetical protein
VTGFRHDLLEFVGSHALGDTADLRWSKMVRDALRGESQSANGRQAARQPRCRDLAPEPAAFAIGQGGTDRYCTVHTRVYRAKRQR